MAALRLKVDEPYRRLNDLEDRHKALSHAALNMVRVMRPKGLLLLDRLRALPRQVRDAVALGIRRGRGPPACWP